jgi:UrcA family protein
MNTSTQTMTGYRLIAVLGTALAIGSAVPAHAQDLTGRDIAVRYEKHALDTERGAARLLIRIRSAARRVCEPLDHGDLVSRDNAKECTELATSAAVHKVNHPMLVAVYNSTQIAPSVASLAR